MGGQTSGGEGVVMVLLMYVRMYDIYLFQGNRHVQMGQVFSERDLLRFLTMPHPVWETMRLNL